MLSESEKSELAIKHFEEYQANETGEDEENPFVASETLKERDRIWKLWSEFVFPLASFVFALLTPSPFLLSVPS